MRPIQKLTWLRRRKTKIRITIRDQWFISLIQKCDWKIDSARKNLGGIGKFGRLKVTRIEEGNPAEIPGSVIFESKLVQCIICSCNVEKMFQLSLFYCNASPELTVICIQKWVRISLTKHSGVYEREKCWALEMILYSNEYQTFLMDFPRIQYLPIQLRLKYNTSKSPNTNRDYAWRNRTKPPNSRLRLNKITSTK